MHFAFPQECGYPHVSGTSKQERRNATTEKEFLPLKEIAAYVKTLPEVRNAQASESEVEDGAYMAMWASHEELVDESNWNSTKALWQREQRSASWTSLARMVLGLLALIAFVAANVGVIRDFVAVELTKTREEGASKHTAGGFKPSKVHEDGTSKSGELRQRVIFV
jgi:hypothetical protein